MAASNRRASRALPSKREWISVQSSREAADVKPEIEADELGGSPMVAAVSSFLLLAIGAIVPVLPYAFTEGAAAIAVVASGIGLFLLGAAAMGDLYDFLPGVRSRGARVARERPVWIVGVRHGRCA